MSNVKIGLMGLTLSLYKKNIPALMPYLEQFSAELKALLSKTFETIHYPLAYNRKTIGAGFRLFEKQKVDGIILVFLSYSQSLEILNAIRKTEIPLLIWNTQKIAEIDNRFGEQEMLENHGMHGVQDLASVLLREKIDFSIVTGHYRDKKALSAVNDWCVTAHSVSRVSSARIGRIGSIFPQMGDFAITPEVLDSVLGPVTVEIENSELRKFSRFKFSEREVAAKYLPVDVSWSGKIDGKVRLNALKSVQFLDTIVKEKGLSALAVNFEGMGKEMPMPFLGISCLMKNGLGYGGEGDIYSATAVLLGHLLSDNRATFTEMFTTDYKNSRIFISHMGESNIGLRRDGPVRLVLNRMQLGNRIPSVVPVFSIKPGRYTLLNLAGEYGGGLKFISSLVEVEDREPLKTMNTPHFFIKPERNVEDFLTDYSKEGGTHHLALIEGDVRRKLRFFCDIKKVPLVEI
jgi:L-arabinose isomerase